MTQTSTELPGPERQDALAASDAGGKAIRGGMVRVVGYGAGVLLTLGTAPLLLRHLGVAGFGQYVTVLSLVAIVALVADAGLTVLAVREYAAPDAPDRRALMANIVSLRIVIATVGVLAATAFAMVAGYDDVLVAGTAIAGLGVVLTLVQQSYTVPLSVDLRIGTITGLELLTRVLTVVAMIALIVAGAGVLAFLTLTVPVAAIGIVATLIAVRTAIRPQLRYEPAAWMRLLRAAVPVAVASILAALFYRVAVVMLSVLSTEQETGYFSASLRVIEVIVAIPPLITSSAFPLLTRAATEAGARFAESLGRLLEIGLILGGATILLLTLGAEPIIAFLGGDEFAPAVPVLRIQALATAATFLFAIWAAGLWSIHAERRLVLATVVGVACVIVLTAALAPGLGAEGAALSMSISEIVLAGTAGVLLFRARRDLTVPWRNVAKIGLALAAAGALWLTGLPGLALVALGLPLYVVLLVAFGAVPEDVWRALRGATGRLRRSA